MQDIETLPSVGGTISPSDLADWLGVHRTTVYRAIDRGELGAFKFGRQWRIPMSEIERITDIHREAQRWSLGANDEE